jgi:amino acid transporter
MNLAFIMPTVPFLLYGDIARTAHGATASAFWIAAITIGLTIFNFIRISRSHPGSASVYSYIADAIHPNVGFVTAWAMLLFYILIPTTALILCARLISDSSGIPFIVIIIAFAAFSFAVNYFGARIAAKICFIALIFVIAFTLIYILVCILAAGKGAGVGHIVSSSPYKGYGAGFGSVFLGSGAVVLAFLGFESSGTLAPEAGHDRNIIPKSFVITSFISGAFIFLQLYASSLIAPYSQANAADVTLLDVAMTAGGKTLVILYSSGIIIAGLIAVVAGQSAAARLLYALGRVGALPRHIFARRDANPNPHRRLPIINLIMVVVITFILCLLSSQFTLLVGLSRFMGAFVLLAVNVAMLLHGFFAKNDNNIVTALIIPALGFFGSLVAWISPSPKIFLIGLLCIIIGAVVSGIIPRAGGHSERAERTRTFDAPPPDPYDDGDSFSPPNAPKPTPPNGPRGSRRSKREKDLLADKDFRLPPRGRRY